MKRDGDSHLSHEVRFSVMLPKREIGYARAGELALYQPVSEISDRLGCGVQIGPVLVLVAQDFLVVHRFSFVTLLCKQD